VNEELISKRELLEKYGISYGALYRWKRKGLIPEEWFIRKSTVTGQETFFAREPICARVEEILAARDESVSLDELAKKIGGGDAPDERQLIIRMKYGERVIRLCELESAAVRGGDGAEHDITEALKAILEYERNCERRQ